MNQTPAKFLADVTDHVMTFNSFVLFSLIFTFLIAIKEFKPTDATTNPSLILAAAKIEKYSKVIDQAVEYALKHAK